MEISEEQRMTISENLQRLSALASSVSSICETGVPSDDVLMGWELLLWDIWEAIGQIINPKAVGE